MNSSVNLHFIGSTLNNHPDCFTPLPIFPDVVVLLILIIGTLLAPTPQIIKLILRKDVAGINLHTFLFGAISTIAIALDGVLTNWPRFNCCYLISSWNCFQSLLSFLQVFSNWITNFIMYYLHMLLIFFLHNIISFFLIAYFVKNTIDQPKAKLKARLTFTLYCLWLFIGGGIITLFLAPYGKSVGAVKILAYVWTIISTSGIIIQWLPQIYTTWKYKSSGSLSLITLLINSPGAFVTMIFLIRSKQSPGTYIPFFFSGLQQLILIIMLIGFHYQKRKLEKKKNIQSVTLTDDYMEDEISRSLMNEVSSEEESPVLDDYENYEYNGS